MWARLRPAIALAAVVAASIFAAGTATAEEPNFIPAARDEFADAKRRGDDALVSGRPKEALAAYDEAYALRAEPALLYNLGRSHQALGDYPAALTALERFQTTASAPVRARVPGLEILLAEVRKRVATLVVSSDVPGATVRLEGRVLGTTPLPGPVRVNAGAPARLTLEKTGYFTVERTVPREGGAIAAFAVKLTFKQSAAIVTVRSPNAGALVAVDGKAEGSVPSEVTMTPGDHRLELTLQGHRPTRTSIFVAAGEHKELELALEREAPITKKWWFWTGLALVAAGTTVTIIALSTEREPDGGSVGNVKTGLSF